VDVVVPFRGSLAELETLRTRLRQLELRAGDSLLVLDNTPGHRSVNGPVPVRAAPGHPTPGYARNRGVERGKAAWVVFLDADVVPRPDLLERYFDPAPGERTAVVAGGVIDDAVPPGGPPAARYAHIRGLMGQQNSFSWGDWSFAQTSNAAVRRHAFDTVGGFREDIRAAEDADLAYRLKAAGWELERREEASVVHLSRGTVRGFVRQQLLHGAGGGWLDRQYPGSVPARRRPGLVWWATRAATKGLLRAAWERDRDQAIWAVFDPLENISYEFGRSLRNERPQGR
jgi:glycosyltransferase involved in cell wall biosynthesis